MSEAALAAAVLATVVDDLTDPLRSTGWWATEQTDKQVYGLLQWLDETRDDDCVGGLSWWCLVAGSSADTFLHRLAPALVDSPLKKTATQETMARLLRTGRATRRMTA